MDPEEVGRALEAILFAAGEPVSARRMALAIGTEEETVHAQAKILADRLQYERRGIRVIRLEDSYQMVSDGAQGEIVSRALETRKPPRLSAAALETLTVIAYYQPVTKALVEQIRGVDSAYSISGLLSKKLIEERGRLAVPGRPILYGTTPDFLRTFGLASIEELPEVDLPRPDVSEEEARLAMADAAETAEAGGESP